MNVIRAIIAELRTPSGQIGPLNGVYLRAATGVWHAVAGAVAASLFGAWGLGFAAALAVAYWIGKELGDLRRGGSFWDGAEDTVMIALGAWYGAAWWPAMICGAGLYIMAVAAWRRHVSV